MEKPESMTPGELRRWKVAQEVLGTWIEKFENEDVSEENYESAADWRDLNKELQSSESPIETIHIKTKKI